VFNPGRDIDPLDVSPIGATLGRLRRLRLHFNCEPDFLLIGEVPGYQGCHYSVAPFTLER
jgi:hypothetical protein